jgi:hypothetical protein
MQNILLHFNKPDYCCKGLAEMIDILQKVFITAAVIVFAGGLVWFAFFAH